jgi:tetratricopeptide (TPR) repeat protein
VAERLDACAAERGDATAQYNVAIALEAKSKMSLAADYYRKAAKQGHSIAQNNLGVFYNTGEGVKPDPAKAMEWFQRSAEQGNASAYFNLGACLQCKGDTTAAVHWYTKAAAQGDADAQNCLGLCYDNGDGVEQNDTVALEWYAKAAEQGSADACSNLRAWHEENRPCLKVTVPEIEQPSSSSGSGSDLEDPAVPETEEPETEEPLAHRAVTLLRCVCSPPWGEEGRSLVSSSPTGSLSGTPPSHPPPASQRLPRRPLSPPTSQQQQRQQQQQMQQTPPGFSLPALSGSVSVEASDTGAGSKASP